MTGSLEIPKGYFKVNVNNYSFINFVRNACFEGFLRKDWRS